MKHLLALYFFILAIIQMGLFFGIYHYYRSQSIVKPNPYWMNSLVTSVLALMIYSAGIVTVGDVAKTQFSFSVANTLFYIAAVLQALFCLSLNRFVTRRLKIFLAISVAAMFATIEFMRQYGDFESRSILMCSLASIFYIWQIFEIRLKRKTDPSSHLSYLLYASSAELFFALGRLIIFAASSLSIRQVEQIPEVLILMTIGQIVVNTLSYIAIGSYWTEQIAIANKKSYHENEEIKALLLERDFLIASLLKANKTASTGALSAAIAHELNQPLGASSLNIQFLQKKLADGGLSPGVQSEILDTLLADNRRAANIIRTLRSIFLDDAVSSLKLDIGECIGAVLAITKPEITAKGIQIVLQVEAQLQVEGSASEIQQVFLNLINNAIQALTICNRKDKQIFILAKRCDTGIQISIADNGNGVAAEVQNRLFELLTGTKSTGMGLGLWLCKHIITRHGGSIRFEPNEGGGAKFIVELPAS